MPSHGRAAGSTAPMSPWMPTKPQNKTPGEQRRTQRGTQQGELSKCGPRWERRPRSRSALMTLETLQGVCQAACAACDVEMQTCKCATGSRTAPAQKRT